MEVEEGESRRRHESRNDIEGRKTCPVRKTIAWQHQFTRKTYLILSSFFLLAALIVLCVQRIFLWLHFVNFEPHSDRPYVAVVCLTLSVVILLLLSCGFESWRRYSPANLTLVLLFILFSSLTVGSLGAYESFLYLAVLYLHFLVLSVLASTVVFTLQNRLGLASRAGLAALACLCVLVSAGVTCAFVFLTDAANRTELYYLALPGGLAVFYCLVLAWDTRLFLLGAWPIEADEHVFAAVTLYVNMFGVVFMLNRIFTAWKYDFVPGYADCRHTHKPTINTIQTFGRYKKPFEDSDV